MISDMSSNTNPEENAQRAPGKVLVIAPRFPSINQPWMDTYLEQLLEHDVEFIVVSSLKDIGPYAPKVDKLGLRARTITVRTDNKALIETIASGIAKRPWAMLKLLIRASRLPRPQSLGLRKRIGFRLRAFVVQTKLAELDDVRLIHLHSLGTGQHFIPYAHDKKIPVVTTFHGLEPSGVPQVPDSSRRYVFDNSKHVVLNTEFAKSQAISLGCRPSDIIVLPQGLPLTDFPYSPSSIAKNDETIEILSVGRFHRDKGQAFSLLAAKRLVAGGYNITWRFVGVGPERRRLMTCADRLGISSDVQFLEGLSTDELRALYARSHLFVLASTSSPKRLEHVETQGVVLQEAQASGCIPIATRVGGIPECIEHGVDGMLVRDRSHRAIYNAVRDLVQCLDRWPTIQQAGRKTVEENFSADVVGRRMATLLRQVARV